MALTLFCVLLALLLFTFIQPTLPGQYPANLIINHPITQIQMSNIAPSLTTVKTRVEVGTELIVTPYENERWSAVSNVLASLKAREQFTVLEYGDSYCYVEINGQRGYVKNDFTTKLKLPEDYTQTPYTARSNFPIKLYSSPADCTNNGDALFVETRYLDMDGDHAVTNAACALRILPSTAPFLFGTNNLGQDLWAMVWSGTRTSLFIGFMVAVIEAFTGIVVGVLWGYVRRLDRLLTAVYNVVDNAPTTIVLVLISYIMRPGVGTLIFAMCLTGWVGMARFIRNQIVIIRDRDYNLASRCLQSAALFGIGDHPAHGAGHSRGDWQRGIHYLYRPGLARQHAFAWQPDQYRAQADFHLAELSAGFPDHCAFHHHHFLLPDRQRLCGRGRSQESCVRQCL